MDYKFTKNNFPANGKIGQTSGDINDDDTLHECTILAGHILGVECCDTVMKGDRALDFDITFFQITPDPYQAPTETERRNYDAFNNYFYANYGKHKDRCYFDTEQEAFYNIVKAWNIWKHLLTDDVKKEYFQN